MQYVYSIKPETNLRYVYRMQLKVRQTFCEIYDKEYNKEYSKDITYKYNDDKFVKFNVRKTREDAKRHSCVYIALFFVRQL